MLVETSQLQTLVTVANAESFSRAADELQVTQSAISQSVKNLEKKLGVTLFKRSGKRVILTMEGEKMYSMASEFLKQMANTLEEISVESHSMKGEIRIGTLMGVGKSWLVPEMMDFAQGHNDITVTVKLGFQEDLVRDFENYRLDFIILPETALPSVGERIFLSEERSTLVFPKSDEFNITEETGLEELASFPTILFEASDPLYTKWCKERFKKSAKNINTRLVVNSHGNILQAVSSGLGIAVIPTHVLDRSFFRDKVSTLGPEFEISNERMFLIHHKGSEKLVRLQEAINRLLGVKNPLGHGV